VPPVVYPTGQTGPGAVDPLVLLAARLNQAANGLKAAAQPVEQLAKEIGFFERRRLMAAVNDPNKFQTELSAIIKEHPAIQGLRGGTEIANTRQAIKSQMDAAAGVAKEGLGILIADHQARGQRLALRPDPSEQKRFDVQKANLKKIMAFVHIGITQGNKALKELRAKSPEAHDQIGQLEEQLQLLIGFRQQLENAGIEAPTPEELREAEKDFANGVGAVFGLTAATGTLGAGAAAIATGAVGSSTLATGAIGAVAGFLGVGGTLATGILTGGLALIVGLVVGLIAAGIMKLIQWNKKENREMREQTTVAAIEATLGGGMEPVTTELVGMLEHAAKGENIKVSRTRRPRTSE
jgi:hypothetical protein